jgi:TPP-dependent pyruvate/acetoin dehydrogenase alpha subunit
MNYELKMPDLSTTGSPMKVVHWLVTVGEFVERGQLWVPGGTVDGNDVLAVYEAARRAVEECRTGVGPVLLELLTYRLTGHSRRDPCHYQPKEERSTSLRSAM